MQPIGSKANRMGNDSWFGALMRNLIEFRLNAFHRPTIAMPWMDESRSPDDYSLSFTCEMYDKGERFHWYIELSPPNDGTDVSTLEGNAESANIVETVDSLVLWALHEANIEVPEKLTRFLSLSPFVYKPYDVRRTGELAAKAEKSPPVDPFDLEREYKNLYDSDGRNLLAQYILAKALFRTGAYAGAAEIYQDLISVIPEYQSFHAALVASLFESGRHSDAVKAAASAESRGFSSLRLLTDGARALTALGRDNRAERAFKRVLIMQPSNEYALLFLAERNNETGNHTQALKYAERAIHADTENARAWLEKGRAWTGMGKIAKAVTPLKKALSLSKGDIDVHLALAENYLQQNRPKKAARHYKEVLAGRPDDYSAHINHIQSLILAGEKKDAAEALAWTESFFTAQDSLRKGLGIVALEMGDTLTAMNHLEGYIHGGGGISDPEALTIVGDIHMTWNNTQKAFFAYNHALSAATKKSEVRRKIADMYLRSANYGAAVPFLEKVLAEHPEDAEAELMIANALWETGRKSEALKHYLSARERGTTNPKALERIAGVYFAQKNHDAAENEYRRILDIDGRSAVARYRIAAIALSRKRVDQAEDHLKKADTDGTLTADDYYVVAKGFEDNNRILQAVLMYEKAREIDDTDREIVAGLARTYEIVERTSDAADSYMRLYEVSLRKDGSALIKAGKLYEAAGEKNNARLAYRLYVDGRFGELDIRFRLARLERERGNHASVAKLLQGLSDDAFRTPEERQILADAYFRTKRYDRAIPLYDQALKDGLRDNIARERLALSYKKTDDYQSAAQAYLWLVRYGRVQSRSRWAFELGRTYEYQNNPGRAIGQYLTNISIYPDNAKNYDRLSYIYMKNREFDKARQILEKAITVEHTPDTLLRRLGDVCKRQRDRHSASRYYRRYLEENPKDAVVWLNLAALHKQRALHARAADAFAHAAKLRPNDAGILVSLGQSLANAGDLKPAARRLEKAYQLDSTRSTVINDLIRVYRRSGNREHLINWLRRSLERDPDDFSRYEELGKTLLSVGSEIEGIAALEKALTLQTSADLRLYLARQYEKDGDHGKARSHLREVVKADAHNADALYSLARYALADKDTTKAVNLLRRTMQAAPKHGEALKTYAAILTTMGKPDQAYDAARVLVLENRYDIEGLALYTEIAYETGKKDEALDAALRVLKADSNNTVAQRVAGILQTENGVYDEAEILLNKAIVKQEDCVECYRSLGIVYREQQEHAEAVTHFKRVDELTGFDADALMQIAKGYERLGKSADAFRTLGKLVDGAPGNAEALYRFGRLQLNAGLTDDARQTAEKLRGLSRANPWVHLMEGELYEFQREFDKALISYGVALKLNPGLPEAYVGTGRVELAERRFARAIQHLGKAVQYRPYDPEIMVLLADAGAGAGDTAAAEQIYREILDEHPDVGTPYLRLAQHRSERKLHDEAITMLKMGLGRNEKNADLYMALGREYVATQRFEPAIAAYKRAVEIGGNDYRDAYLRISEIYADRLGNQKAAEGYRKKFEKAGKPAGRKKFAEIG